ncbi:hypothetical protein Leryth_006944 [Lithospermum erythrorhizon]|nr:hypothetical protein Leryth_006944 [Lithospermum erythrorhizon]
MAFLRFIFLLVLLNTSITYCQENHTPHVWKGPLVITYKENNEHQLKLHQAKVCCEANNLVIMETIPKECHHHVKDYILGMSQIYISAYPKKFCFFSSKS